MTQDIEHILDECPYTLKTLGNMYGVSYQLLSAWGRGVKPQKKYQPVLERIMKEMKDQKKLQKHPSYGWATEEQILRLKEIGLGPERDNILARIAKQTKLKGKSS